MNNLPEEILCIISGYYGNKIPSNLSNDINDYRLLLFIKEKDYYYENTNTWNITEVINKLKSYPYFNSKKYDQFNNLVIKKKLENWNQYDKQVNILWYLHNTEERKEIFKTIFQYNL
jgi:hypothetical protein